ncbi:MAG: ATP-grasp domain-containing protein [Gemmataceae bacterium]
MNVLVYEHLSAGEMPDEPSLLREGAAMLEAVRFDLQALPQIEVQLARSRAEIFQLAPHCQAALIIAPEIDDILGSIIAGLEAFPDCRLLGPDSATVRLTADKHALAEHLSRAGVPTPPTTLLNGSVIKPRYGAGCQHTFLTYNDYILQPHIPGMAASVAFIDGKPLRGCMQTIVEIGGLLSYQGGWCPLDAALEMRAVTLAQAAIDSLPNRRGYLGVDLVLADRCDHDVVIEINPRLTTSYLGLQKLARNNLMAVLLGLDVSPLCWHSGRITFSSDGILSRLE